MLRAVMSEIASVVTHLARYPTAVGRRWTIAAPAPPTVLERPLVVLPGLADNAAIFTELRRALPGPVVSFGYSPLIGDVRVAAGQLAEQIEELCAVAGVSTVDVVGHSLGGLIARYYVQRLGGHRRVHHTVTIATPHRGTVTAWLLSPLPLVRQLRPGSDLFEELTEPAPECTARFVTFSSTADALILPARNAQLEHPDLTVRNVVIADVGHLALAADRDVIAEIRALLVPESPAEELRSATTVPRSA
ncbi:lipase [Amycolatopsis taiwanensis]|uniref:Lipase n=2 Tax=Amycolatopsis taiwanensis TaxID=342230 RepID=A0A9W6VET4_9PSEU|nr:lipase [Amycolatopsis taiwanensis]